MVHRRSKISRLPEPIIQQINEFLDANAEYQRIIDWLTQQGHPEIEMYHISRWRDSGYQDWLQEQEHFVELDRKLQWAEKQAKRESHLRMHKAAMALISLKLFDAFNRLDSTDLSRLLESKPEKILTLVNSYARYAHEVIEEGRFHEEQQANAKAMAPRQHISEEARARVLEELRVALRLPASTIAEAAPEPPAIATSPETNAADSA